MSGGFIVPILAAGEGWWSLQPLVRPAVPGVGGEDAERAEGAIDRFIIAKQREQGLGMAPEADRRTLIRRVYFDVTGLPPTPEEVEEFVNDPDPEAYAKLVDALLASPRHGERWARHWLDVVHYGETHGYDKDQPRPNAWPYRDYVIRAINEDKPYARFVQEQLAGDVLWPETVDGIVATGFISAGPWDLIGHAEVPEEKIDGKVARHLDRDDMVMTTMNAFCSITVQCAQCHDHKLDPVTMRDYYSLQSVFAALDRADRPYDANAEVAAKRAGLEAQRSARQSELAEVEAAIAARKTPEVVALEEKIASLEGRLNRSGVDGARSDRYGYHSEVAAQQDSVKWVQVDLGASRAIEHLVVAAADEYGFADFGFPLRFKVEVADDPDFRSAQVLADHTGTDYPRPGADLIGIEGKGASGRYVRLTGTKLWNRRQNGQPLSGDWIFAIGEMAVLSGGELVAVREVTALDSIELPPRWSREDLVDGVYGAQRIEALFGAGQETSGTNGYHSSFAQEAEAMKWVQLDLGREVEIDRIDLYPAHPTDFRDAPGFGFPRRFTLEVSEDPAGEGAVVFTDRKGADYPNPGAEAVRFEGVPTRGRYVRLRATVLDHPEGASGAMLAMAEMRVFSAGADVSRGAVVNSQDTINSGRWHEKHLVDGHTSRVRIQGAVGEELARLVNGAERGVRTELAALQAERDGVMAGLVDPAVAARREELAAGLAEVGAELEALGKQQLVYAGTVHRGGGTFVGRGHLGGKPREIHILNRGNVTEPREAVGPATVPGVVPGVSPVFDLGPDHAEGARRVALAKWITHPENTLTWRSIVNRVWQYHFGRGIVETPNDFGRVGGQPSHPELLDWLAVEFRDGGGSWKALHRLILNSAVYKQGSAHREDAAALDGSNQYLWRQNRRRLEAEALRDAVLAVAGKLDLKMGGPSFMDFVIERPEHSPHYQYHLADHDDPAAHRRSIYRFLVRSQPQPFMDTLDCADPSQLVDRRGETTTALQALALLNNGFMVRMAEHFAARVEGEQDPVARAVALALGRPPTPDEHEALTAFAAEHGLAAMGRLVFNLNEFNFVD